MWLVSQNTKVPLQSFKTKHEAHAWGRERLHGWFIVWQGKGVRGHGGKTTDQGPRALEM